MNARSLAKREFAREESSSSSATEDEDDGDVLGFNKTVESLRQSIEYLLKEDDMFSRGYYRTLKNVQSHTRYRPGVVIGQELVKKLVTFKIGNVLVRILRSTESINILEEENAIAFKIVREILSCIWNCTHKSRQMCEDLIGSTVTLTLCEKLNVLIKNFTVCLVRESSTQNVEDRTQKVYKTQYLCKAYLSILHNVARQCADIGSFIKIDCLRKLSTLDLHKLIKAKVCILLAYVTTGNDCNYLIISSDVIEFLLQILERAIKMENFFDQDTHFEAYEIVAAINRLAINDVNKELLGESGAIELYLAMLSDGGAENQRVAAAGLWILAFNRQNRVRMRSNDLCVKMLRKLAVSGCDEGIRRSARAAEFVLRFEAPEPIRTFSENAPHVMLSYNHSTQPTMLKLYKFLQKKGFNVWMDVDHMRGSTLDAMALAVERSAVIIIGVCKRYQDSASCRTEGDYAYQLRKAIIPVNLEKGFVPTGWLGCLLGTKLAYDLWDETRLEEQMNRVVFDLGERGRLPPLEQAPPVRISTMREPNPNSTGSAIVAAHLGVPRDDCTRVAEEWTTEQTRAWLERNNIPATGFLESLDGKLLVQLRKMYQAAPECFYRALKSDLDYDVVAALRLANMLDSINL
ncbi:unnamed protein product [Dimorphilus gyrociliatus]|uniref:TIR domain-containing protein n=1 Tax=Dimorphilus gyrociliatus TaxID=2664684 RepID=A0A7I8WD60_9ANNE|nr:unnamed protein product [Dimorphilus gyrociliatus]